MGQITISELTDTELREFRRLAGFMVPASTTYGVPGADDPAIFSDIAKSLGRDQPDVRKALALLRELAGGDFTTITENDAEASAMALLQHQRPEIMALGRAVLQCYYRDERVIVSLGLEPGSPFPKGRTVEQSDWSILDAVRNRAPMWRDVDDAGN